MEGKGGGERRSGKGREGKMEGEKEEGEEEEGQEEGRWAGRVETWRTIGKVRREGGGRAASPERKSLKGRHFQAMVAVAVFNVEPSVGQARNI